MKRGILKRAIALCMVGIMTFALTACGDSENQDEGEEIVQESTQDSEEGTIEAAESEEAADTVNSSENIVVVAHVSSSGSNGNGTTAPVFKPGEELQPGEESQPGEGPEPGAGSGTQPSAGTQQSQPGTGTQSGTGTQQPQQPQQSQPSTGTQQPQQPQQSQSGTQPQQPQQPQQPSTGNQTAHTHNWVTKTVHHDATGHYESRVTTEQVLVKYSPAEYKYKCSCGALFDTDLARLGHGCEMTTDKWGNVTDFGWKAGHGDEGRVRVKEEEFIYEDREKVESVWVQDTAAWDETVTTCSTCGAKQ